MVGIRQYGVFTWVFRTFQLAIDTIVLALASALVNQQTSGGSPGKINFSVAVGSFAILTFFLTAVGRFLPTILGNPWLIAFYDFVNWVFALTGGCCIAVAIRVHACDNQKYLDRNHYTQGSMRRCQELKALCFFLWFMFGLYVASFIVQIFIAKNDTPNYTFRGRGRGKGSGPAVAPRPVMSAV
ncbi:Non classical export pathway protein [Schizosaccharomyces pombe]|uniref:Non-classical export protein 2 homolog n=1 Tax=Schizosaccharomyces pombe (strain 972 / ATCC 24843) TaxID=284812 RepID=NCE2_SCHPO|nr:Fhn1 plasma membrane organization protein [Schizosaccharomyces pombe]O74333.1 RecName: Full=Non-classical export protein 2 homolog [Schizosaccharomyces pombe 972h-]CAA20061.1 Fhn1 plasma membrane organization protein [Schizosaccharomyces pombe]|eukprot:NP_595217.1 Fhn1 plasma membrane organization protein [Schizosaccharomyces pombe]